MPLQSEPETKIEIEPLDPLSPPPLERYCDIVMDGGVINGVVYPGFLVELARKFNFSSIGGTSVGAVAGALAAACEYSRRYSSLVGFNDGLRKMPQELAEPVGPGDMTRIRSLFQPNKNVQQLFDFAIDLLAQRIEKERERTEVKPSDEVNTLLNKLSEVKNSVKSSFSGFVGFLIDCWIKGNVHFGPKPLGRFVWLLCSLMLMMLIAAFTAWWTGGAVAYFLPPDARYFLVCVLWLMIYLLARTVLHPAWMMYRQLKALLRIPGFGICSGMSNNENRPALTQWLYDGIQKAARLPYGKPLTFSDLWNAPNGPKASDGSASRYSIQLKMMSTCLSHGRAYELPTSQANEHIMFRLSELKEFFPSPVIAHLRSVSKVITTDSEFVKKLFFKRSTEIKSRTSKSKAEVIDALSKLNQRQQWLSLQLSKSESVSEGFHEPDIRLLPAGDLPIVVAARMSMSCPVLFQAIPMLGFNFDKHAEDIDLVRLWFSDGGVASNFPIHLFDKALPRWPTFGLKILEASSREIRPGIQRESYVPYHHMDGAVDLVVDPLDKSAFTQLSEVMNLRSFMKFILGLYVSAKDGHDKSNMPMPEVRNRVVNLYLNQRSGGGLNLMITQDKIIELGAKLGADAGKNIANAYLGQVGYEKYRPWVNSWNDHRWVRLNLLMNGLRQYLDGFSVAVQGGSLFNEKQSENSIYTTNENKPYASMYDQINDSVSNAPLRWFDSDESTLTQAQAAQLRKVISLVAQLEQDLKKLNHVMPYKPAPEPALRFQPRL